MIAINERFLVNAGSKHGIDSSLPLRLQKRELLKALGFPGDPKLKRCQSCKTCEVKQLLKEYCAQGYPFLIIVSEKPMFTLVPPLFVVDGSNSVKWRDNRGIGKVLSANEALAVIKQFPQTTWVEFAPCPWNERTIAGRLIYASMESQILEIQQGTVPSKLINNRQLPTYSGELSFFEVSMRDYFKASRRLKDAGYLNTCSFDTVRGICRKMPPMASFEELHLVSQLPTLEFTFTGQLMAIDIDWPAQYIEKKGDR